MVGLVGRSHSQESGDADKGLKNKIVILYLEYKDQIVYGLI
jgi:hypothetical protein